MKNLVLIIALFAAASYGAERATNANSGFRFPIRVIDSQRVDLHYLFAHWRTGSDAVTNSRWVLLTGTIAEDTPGGWVVEGKTESASGLEFHQKVFLINPPRAEEQTLEGLLAEEKELKDENSSLESDANSLKKIPKHRGIRINHAVVAQDETNLHGQESGVETNLNQIEKEVAAIPTTSSAHGGRVYHVDFFVLSTGTSRAGMPVLDFGLPSR